MPLPFFKWSKTAASNATADPTINWQEGQAPSTVNDSARAMMASSAAYRDDISGSIVTGGTSTAYTLTSNQVFDSLSNMGYQMIAFTPHATNTGPATLNVDGLGAKPIVIAPDVALQSGMLILGTPYVALYRNDFGTPSFVLQGLLGNPYNIPLAGGMDYWGASAPNSSFAFPVGQAISRSTYATLFAIMGTAHGAGDGSTTFNLPDKRGRVSASLDNMGGSAASRLNGVTMTLSGQSLGAVGGTQTHTLTTPEIPSHTHANTLNDPGHTHVTDRNTGVSPAVSAPPAGTNWLVTSGNTNAAFTGMSINNVAAGGGGAHLNVQPTIMCNYIIRII